MDITTIRIKQAEHDGRQALEHACQTLQQALQKLQGYVDQYDAAEDPKDKAQVLNWALHHLATFIPSNQRLDMMASAQAKWASIASD